MESNRYKDAEGVNSSNYDEIAKKLVSEISEYNKIFADLDEIVPREKATNRTKCAMVKTESDSDKETERRFCRCLYYSNNPHKGQGCENCLMKDKQSEGYHTELVGNFKVISYEFVPTDKQKGQNVGNVDIILADENFAYLTEVKPLKSTETLLRMFLEIETYYRVVIRGHQYEKIVNGKPLRKAIMFFEGSEQQAAFKDEKQAKYTKQLIKIFGVTVFCAKIVNDKVLIEAIA